ncbi:MAG: phytanoyl-CoA dioxygenase family protein [Candidatus Poribacteria bacterium]|nr:phytanoyl-CoA dioxygenase family protein [Candidatus Poribacteria bacterium]
MAKILKSTDLESFQQQGYVRIPEAFSPVDALAMQDFIWDKLEEKCSILRSDPNTWDKHVTGLNKSAENTIYSDIASQRMCRAIDDLLGEGTWETPKKWGSFLVSFPQKLDHNWTVPTNHCNGIPWHWDGRSGIEGMETLSGVFVFTFFSAVKPLGGGTLIVSGSHLLLKQFFQNLSEADRAKKRRVLRKQFCTSNRWLAQLTGHDESPIDRIAFFMDKETIIDDVPVHVVELTGKPGDAIICQPTIFHIASENRADYPRFMRVKGIEKRKLT